METVTLAPHEFHANLLYNDDGPAPFFVCDSAVKRAEGSKAAQFQHDGEHWRAQLSYQSSNIVHPGERTPQGTDWQLQQMREYRIKVYRDPAEDPIGEQDFTAHVAPRWEGMQGERKDGSRMEIPVPDGFDSLLRCWESTTGTSEGHTNIAEYGARIHQGSILEYCQSRAPPYSVDC